MEQKQKSKGFVPLYRDILDHWIWTGEGKRVKEPFDCRSALIDLLLNANYKAKEISVEGKKVVVGRGQKWTSISNLEKRWNWSRGRVRRYLAVLEANDIIHTDRTSNGTLITLVNYEHFGVVGHSDDTDDDTDNGTDGGTGGDTTGGTAGGTQTIKEIKKTKKKGKQRNNFLSTSGGSDPEEVVYSFSDDVQAEAFDNWMKHKPHLSDQSRAAVAEEIRVKASKHGSQYVAECVRHAIGANYKGIVWNDTEKKKGNPERRSLLDMA